jgi:RNA polymerase sigma-54 factor
MGYIRRSVPDMVDDMAFTQGIYTDERWCKKMLQVIHELEPSGVGAQDLKCSRKNAQKTLTTFLSR